MTKILTINHVAWCALRQAGTRGLPREVGGLLLGYYTETGPYVTEIQVVPDPRATRIRYRRDACTAERVLDASVSTDASGVLGYLGEWHTHPLAVGPSTTDVQTTRQLAIAGGYDVALLVLAMGAGGWAGHALNADPAGRTERIKIHVEGPNNER